MKIKIVQSLVTKSLSYLILICGLVFLPAGNLFAGVQANVPLDFNGDGRTDYALTRFSGGNPNQAIWYTSYSGILGSHTTTPWGLSGDIRVPADYDGDNITDIAVWRQSILVPGSPATFYILNSQTQTVRSEQFGNTGDNPRVVGDYDGDGKTDLAVFRPGGGTSQSFWYYRGSLNNPNGIFTTIPWGSGDNTPYAGDFDGDGKADFTVRSAFGNQSMFWTQYSSGANYTQTIFGSNADEMALGDYDGDGKTDLVLTRAFGSQLQWWIRNSSTGVITSGNIFGLTGDFVAPGDYDGDGRTDLAVWRGSAGIGLSRFWVKNIATSQITQFSYGVQNDYPVANTYAY